MDFVKFEKAWIRINKINPNLLIFSFLWAFFVLLFLYVYPVSEWLVEKDICFIDKLKGYLNSTSTPLLIFSHGIGIIVVLVLESMYNNKLKNKRPSYKYTCIWGFVLLSSIVFLPLLAERDSSRIICCFSIYSLSVMFIYYSYSVEKVEIKKLKSSKSVKKPKQIEQ